MPQVTNTPNNSDPSNAAAAVVPHDTNELTSYTRALYIGGAGNLVAVFPDGSAVTFTGVPAGSILPIRVKRVNSTNTTATNIVALY